MNNQEPGFNNQSNSHLHGQDIHSNPEHYHAGAIKEAAEQLLEEGMKTLGNAQESLKEYSDVLIQNVQKNPVAALLVAGGVGFILSSLIKK